MPQFEIENVDPKKGPTPEQQERHAEILGRRPRRVADELMPMLTKKQVELAAAAWFRLMHAQHAKTDDALLETWMKWREESDDAGVGAPGTGTSMQTASQALIAVTAGRVKETM